MADIVLRLRTAEMRLSMPLKATEDLEALVEQIIAAVKAAGGSVSREIRFEEPL